MKNICRNRTSALAVFLLSALVPSNGPAGDLHRLGSLNLDQMTTGWGVPRADRGIAGGPLTLGNIHFDRGVGTHAASKFRIELRGEGERLQAQVGVDDSAGGRGSVEFIVLGDKQILWRSGLLRGGQPPIPLEVNLLGVQVLELRVTDGGDGASHDHADWADAAIVMRAGAKPPKPLPPRDTFTVATRSFEFQFEIGEDGRLYQRPLGAKDPKQPLERVDEAFPQAGDGYIWEPALQAVHADGNTSTALLFNGVTRNDETGGRQLVRIHLRDPAYPFDVYLCFRVHAAEDVIEQWTEVRHQESGSVKLDRLASSAPLLAPENLHLTHFHGNWADEMNPVTELLTPGLKVLDSKIGVRAHQFRNPSFILSLDGPPQETSGRVLAGSLAWSGSFQCAFDHTGKRVRAWCGINPFASTYFLPPATSWVSPVMIWTWSDTGLGAMSRKLHAWARQFGFRDGHKPREVLLNNWEATGFDFDFHRIAGLFPPAREMGVELFLLDDGWFGNKYPRTNDHAGLGDWEPNRQRFPEGLAPLAAAAAKAGLRFGIWIEPEMVNPRSELFEQHPDWVIRQPKRELELQRNQLTLDLTRPEVREFEWQVINQVLGVPGVAYAKWDCNRYLTQPGSPWLPAERQSHLWIDYVRALYDLMERTAKAYPATELMLCSGGGGRVDYGALRFFHEFWPSDNTDPLRRVTMQWDYSYFFPAMTIASHVTHWGNRPMHFACCVAMSARFGMDLDLARLPEPDKAVCAGAIAAYKRIRDVTHLGQLYRLERPHGAPRGALSYVTDDRRRAVGFVFQLKDGPPMPVHFQGLDPAAQYVVRELNPLPGRDPMPQHGRRFSGAELMQQGVVPSCSRAVEACAFELAP